MQRRLCLALLLASSVALQGCDGTSGMPTVPPPPPPGTKMPAPTGTGVIPKPKNKFGSAPKPAKETPNAL